MQYDQQQNLVQCLNVISDENSIIQNLFYRTPNAIQALMIQLSDESKGFLYRVGIAGVGLNICTPQDFLKVVEQVLNVLLTAADYDPLNVLVQLVPELDKEEEDLRCEEWKNRCDAQKMSFELLANIATVLAFPNNGDDDFMEDFDDENADESAEEHSIILESSRPEFIHLVTKTPLIPRVCLVQYVFHILVI